MNLPNNVYKPVKEDLDYVFEQVYGVEWYHASNQQRTHFLGVVAAFLSNRLDDCLEDE